MARRFELLFGRSSPLVAAFEEWMRAERAKLSRNNAVAKAIDYMLTRWPAVTRFLDDGRICRTTTGRLSARRRVTAALRGGYDLRPGAFGTAAMR
jgi:hypothetical protein